MTDVAPASTTVRPGALTALLGELAQAPDATGWAVPAVPGETIGRFEILREIGRGGFGVVYEARDRELGRSVAFKAIRAGSSDAAREQQALAEAEAAARLAHPNIVHLYDVGRCDRGAFLIMELLHGESLDDRLARGPLKLRDAVHVATEIARGLAHAHEQGVVHRDLKPGNVFLCDDGQVKVLDFGLAHVFGRGGIAGGTPAYMAPEQARGEECDERADVWALGVMVRELVSGTPPAPALSPAPESVPTKRRELRGAPAALAKLVSSMLATDPAERPASAVQVHAQLVAIRKSLEPRRLLWAAWAVAAIALATALVLALRARPLPPGRLLVAMADLANATGDPDLDAAGPFLETAIEQSQRVALIARSRLVNVLAATGAARQPIGEDSALAAAREAGAHLVMIPTVRRVGPSYDVAVRAVSVERREPLFTLRETFGGKGGVTDAVDRLSTRLLRELREDPANASASRVKVADFAPANPEAWRHFAEWQRLSSEGRDEEARAAFERGLAADPDYPLAHVTLLLETVQGEKADLDEAYRHAEIARRNAHRIPAKERTLVEAITGVMYGGSQAERLRLLDRAIANWPEDPRAHVWAGNILMHQYADITAARPYLEKALQVAPLAPGTAINFLVALGRLDEALERAERLAAERADPWSYAVLSRVHRFRGEPGRALEAARRSVALDTTPVGPTQRWGFVDADAIEELESVLGPPEDRAPHWLALRGRWREALVSLDTRAPPSAGPKTARAWYHLQRAGLFAYGGFGADAIWPEVEEQFRNGTDQLPCNVESLAVAGDFERARILGDGTGTLEQGSCYRVYRMIETWKRGDPEGALTGFGEIFAHGSSFYRGEILAELGRDREAVEAFRAYRRMPDFPWGEQFYDQFRNAAYYPRSMYLEAVALERLGQPDEALKLLDRLLRLWNRADRDAPMVREAKALRTRLSTGRAP